MHDLMDYFYRTTISNGAIAQQRSNVIGIHSSSGGYEMSIDESGNQTSFTSDIVINAAGLQCDTIAELIGIDVEKAGYRLNYVKGS